MFNAATLIYKFLHRGLPIFIMDLPCLSRVASIKPDEVTLARSTWQFHILTHPFRNQLATVSPLMNLKAGMTYLITSIIPPKTSLPVFKTIPPMPSGFDLPLLMN